jgi:hypothetical protein
VKVILGNRPLWKAVKRDKDVHGFLLALLDW